MKGNMSGLIRPVPRREMEKRSQGSTKGTDIPPVYSETLYTSHLLDQYNWVDYEAKLYGAGLSLICYYRETDPN